MREWLGPMSPGSLLILDEAHHAAPSSGGRYGIETKFTRAVRDLSERFEHRLFLSATPHNGHSNSFSTLLELLDPYRFTRGVPVRGRRVLDDVMVRRLKEDLRDIQGGLEVSVSWALTRPANEEGDEQRATVTLEPPDAPVLREAAQILSDRQERADERIEGYVSALARDQSEPEGRATIKAVIDGALTSVKADFSPLRIQQDNEGARQPLERFPRR